MRAEVQRRADDLRSHLIAAHDVTGLGRFCSIGSLVSLHNQLPWLPSCERLGRRKT